MDELRVGLVGAGHLGSRHARVLGEMPGVRLSVVCDVDRERASACAPPGARVLVEYRELDGVDAVVVAAPTSVHKEITQHFIEAGVAVLLEKPMTRTLEEAEELERLVRERGAFLQVGHIERFNPAVVAALEHVKNPRFIEARRVAPFSFRSTDIGVVHDLMIHDIDLVLYLVRSPVRRVEAMGAAVLGGKEDIANARIVFEDGCVLDATASRIAAKAERALRIFQEDSYITLDALGMRARLLRPREKLLSGRFDPSRIPSGDPKEYFFRELVEMRELPLAKVEPLRAELDAFCDAVRKKGRPVVDAVHGLNTMRVAEMIIKEIWK